MITVNGKKLINLQELGKALNLSHHTVRKYMAAGFLQRGRMVGKRMYFDEEYMSNVQVNNE